MADEKAKPGCPICASQNPVVRLQHAEDIAETLFYWAGRYQVEWRGVEVGDVVVVSTISLKPVELAWDNIGVVIEVMRLGDYKVWTACGISTWMNMGVRNYGRARGYDDELPAF